MPKIRFAGAEATCAQGARLRDALLAAGLTPHNGNAAWFNCKGFGTCGTCAVEVHGETSPQTARERWRLSFPPHEPQGGLRLACQARVLGDVTVKKHEGFWGQRLQRRARPGRQE